jgi:hypothetical protein
VVAVVAAVVAVAVVGLTVMMVVAVVAAVVAVVVGLMVMMVVVGLSLFKESRANVSIIADTKTFDIDKWKLNARSAIETNKNTLCKVSCQSSNFMGLQ